MREFRMEEKEKEKENKILCLCGWERIYPAFHYYFHYLEGIL